MELPQNAVGISDLIGYTECPRKMSWQMRRHVGKGEQSEASMPEASQYGAVYARYYGSAIHEVIHDVEDGFGDDIAIQRAWTLYGEYLEPDDLDMLRADLEVYRTRDVPQARLVASEEDARVPLFVHDVYGQIYFRFKLDRLYERLDAPGTFIHKDYKSSRHAKSQKDVDGDKQMWSYNWGIHELYPEVERLIQLYDQLRFGEIVAQRKTDAHRRLIKEWLVKTATAVLDRQAEADGLLPAKKNDWCAWCPIMESCPVVDHLLEFGRVEIEALAPTVKDGRKTTQLIDPSKIDEYIEKFDEAKQAIGILERFRDSVADILRKMPDAERAVRGYDLKPRTATQFTLDAKRELLERLGPDEFLALANLTKTGLESHLGEDKELFDWAMSLANQTVGAAVLTKRKDP